MKVAACGQSVRAVGALGSVTRRRGGGDALEIDGLAGVVLSDSQDAAVRTWPYAPRKA